MRLECPADALRVGRDGHVDSDRFECRKHVDVSGHQRTPRLDDEPFELHERLRSWRRERSDKEGMDSSLVLNRHVMLRLAMKRPKSLEQIGAVEGLRAWQLERFGDDLLHLAITFEEDLAAGRIDFDRRKKRRR